MARYIDENKIKFNGFTFEDADKEVYIRLSDVRQAIAQTPTEDVVKVVRCCDCGMSRETEDERYLFCMEFADTVDCQAFCSYGERK